MSKVTVQEPATDTVSSPRQRSVCAYPWQQMMIDLTGEVVPCCFWSGYANAGRPLGNTNVDTIDEIWNGPGYQELRRRIVEDDDESFPCHRCMASTWQGGTFPPFEWPSSFGATGGFGYSGPILRSVLEQLRTVDAAWHLREDGVELGPLVDSPAEVQDAGGGRFHVTPDGELHMSASDDSSPNENGRQYELRRGHVAWTIKTTRFDSTSGRNLKTAREEYLAQATVLAAKPTLLSFISTADCNIDCGHCSQNKVRKFRVQHRPETQAAVLALAPYLIQFVWHGGEPFLIDDFRRFYTDFAVERNPNLAFGFTTNGTMLSERVLGQLRKFPRLHATISMDSFSAESFERLRAGARFDVVSANLLRAMQTYDFPDRWFAVNQVVMKSNVRELANSLRFQQEHDLHVRFSPLVVYPCHERLDIFQDLERETEGWAEAIAEAQEVAARYAQLRNTGRIVRGYDSTGMVEAIRSIVDAARLRYRDTIPVTVHVDDPNRALADMRLPGVILYRRDHPSTPLGYVHTPTAGTYVVNVPTNEFEPPNYPFAHVYHDLRDETDILATVSFEVKDRPVTKVTVTIPDATPRTFIRNLRLSNGGRGRPDGLIVIDPARQL